jgi:uncharacterized protein YkwD
MLGRLFSNCLLFFFFLSGMYAQEEYYQYTLANFRDCKSFNDTIDCARPNSERLNAVIFYLTNEIRIKNGVKELAYHPKLEESARLHSNSMVSGHFFDHINPKSKKLREPNDRARYVGIANPFLAENIIEGFLIRYQQNEPVYYGGPGIFRYHPEDDPIKAHTYISLGESLMERWMNSSKHKANILSPQAVQLGCGTAFYQKEDFYEMPALLATQNFQFYEKIQNKK